MRMTQDQWRQTVSTQGAAESSNALVHAERMVRANRCGPIGDWQRAIQDGSPVTLVCYDSRGMEAGARDMTQAERQAVVYGQRWVTPTGLLSIDGEPRVGAESSVGLESGGLGGVLGLAAVAAAGWYAYQNWATVKGWLGLRRPLQVVRVRRMGDEEGDEE